MAGVRNPNVTPASFQWRGDSVCGALGAQPGLQMPLFDRKESQHQVPDSVVLGHTPINISAFNGIIKKRQSEFTES